MPLVGFLSTPTDRPLQNPIHSAQKSQNSDNPDRVPPSAPQARDHGSPIRCPDEAFGAPEINSKGIPLSRNFRNPYPPALNSKTGPKPPPRVDRESPIPIRPQRYRLCHRREGRKNRPEVKPCV